MGETLPATQIKHLILFVLVFICIYVNKQPHHHHQQNGLFIKSMYVCLPLYLVYVVL